MVVTKGLICKFTGLEIRQHCFNRSEYHAKKATEKLDALPELKKSIEFVVGQNPRQQSTKSSYAFDAEGPIERLEIDIKDHKTKARRFEIFAKHMPEDFYELGINEMKELELV